MTTFAPGITAPVLSVTVPEIVPVVTWAMALSALISRKMPIKTFSRMHCLLGLAMLQVLRQVNDSGKVRRKFALGIRRKPLLCRSPHTEECSYPVGRNYTEAVRRS